MNVSVHPHSSPRQAPPHLPVTVGQRIRHWRQQRQLSQLQLAIEADISSRHLSFVETGRAGPSRELVLRLAQRLDVPLRERNALLEAAGYAPMYRQQPLDAPEMAQARSAVQLILTSHEPWPALALDRHWNLLLANRMVAPLLAMASPALLVPPVNVLRLSLHPEGLAPHIINLGQWRRHLLERLRQQVLATGDAGLAALMDELRQMPWPAGHPDATGEAPELPGEHLGVAMPLQFQSPHGLLNLVGTTTVFGSPVDVTLQELALETLFPADEATGVILRAVAETAFR